MSSTPQDGTGLSEPSGSAPVAARLVLSDGSEFEGRAFGSLKSARGEVVFTTGMVGYPESMTDPSYRGQILVSTYPLIGNYGVPGEEVVDGLPVGFEADRIHVRGLVVSRLSNDHTHYLAARSLHQWMESEGVVGIEGIDTRALTQKLRHEGCAPGKILVDADEGSDVTESSEFSHIGDRNLVAEVSVTEPILYGEGAKRVVLVDCGAKLNIVRSLVSRGVSVLRVPWDYDLAQADGHGILVSNGPGDPKRADATIENLRAAIGGERPVFGICLGNQLVGRAIGCETYKLKFGHRSQNQPCREVGTSRCWITSQNHGYALDTKTLPDEWEEWFVNANDGTNEGIRHESGRFSTVQFHPEATPGPRDSASLFDRFVESL
ncbi:MAG: glutamine-hydrolyzing carbamoyl-phosphate synthase small subunit [Planctomycetota bacterium]